ncbi:hypothetical protein C7W88_18220 (plasmid) [Novosphingobium sp. THN1]|nr:hypothetical protein C7W88_18220 [Novosphingobium sp. THN1]
MGESWGHVSGERNCPPEDCGGIPGFYEMLEARNDPDHPDHADVSEWLDDFDPDELDVFPINGILGRNARRSHGGQRPLQYRQDYGSRPCLGSGRKRGANRRAHGRSRGGSTSRLHCLADAHGRPLAFHVPVGEAADCKAYDALIGLPERAPDALLADKG